MNLSSKRWAVLVAALALALGGTACGDDDDSGSGGSSSGGGGSSSLSGSIRIDGSSTVGPLTEAVAEQFNEENPDVQISVGQAGTGGGFEKFCAGETDINDASRTIESDELAACKTGGVKQDEVTVANDALTVVLNPNNPVTCLTLDQLGQIWGADAVSSWSDVKDLDADFGADIARFGPGTDSGTFDYFTEAVNGEEGVQTKDYNNVGEDDNQTVVGVEGSEGGIGYFGYSYYKENAEGLKAAEIENEKGKCVAPSEESVQAGEYTPLGRELFIYPSEKAMQKPEVKAFVDYYLANVNGIASEVGFIPLTDQQLSQSKSAVKKIG
ncbi:MAG TPA: PstS family phosphate ABC transporter substrate-binding protein [Solirubrobacterales bacterium]|nr:PstS family phosphate ABC transporter substrate-binding protein [Solirubrobacterales bacterium]